MIYKIKYEMIFRMNKAKPCSGWYEVYNALRHTTDKHTTIEWRWIL